MLSGRFFFSFYFLEVSTLEWNLDIENHVYDLSKGIYLFIFIIISYYIFKLS